MIGRVHRRVQCFGGNRSEAVPASGFGSENDHHQDQVEEDMDDEDNHVEHEEEDMDDKDIVEVNVLSAKLRRCLQRS